jgi:hypothetical protein
VPRQGFEQFPVDLEPARILQRSPTIARTVHYARLHRSSARRSSIIDRAGEASIVSSLEARRWVAEMRFGRCPRFAAALHIGAKFRSVQAVATDFWYSREYPAQEADSALVAGFERFTGAASGRIPGLPQTLQDPKTTALLIGRRRTDNRSNSVWAAVATVPRLEIGGCVGMVAVESFMRVFAAH